MEANIRASVAMAVYNGETYIRMQIDSILDMMAMNDELIISYDKSTDNTLQIIKDYELKDQRVHVVYDNGSGVESNFNNAVAACTGKYIFLSDQDDVWINDKINIMVQYFGEHPDIVLLISDGYYVDEKLNIKSSIYSVLHTTINPFRNYIKGTYLGCQMAFAGGIKNKVWPVSVGTSMAHDLWLGVFSSFYGKIGMIDNKLILHRIHENNCSNTRKLSSVGVVKNRCIFLKDIVCRLLANNKY